MRYRAALAIGMASFFVLVTSGCGRGRPHTPLITAARQGDIQAIRALLDAGADPNRPGGVNGWTPVMHAIHKNQEAAAYALLDGGAAVNARSPRGATPLIMAAGYGQTSIVKGLMARGANPRLEDSMGLTALDVALSGVPDIDAFTLGRCQTATVRTIADAAPDLRSRKNAWSRAARLFAAVKSCPE